LYKNRLAFNTQQLYINNMSCKTVLLLLCLLLSNQALAETNPATGEDEVLPKHLTDDGSQADASYFVEDFQEEDQA
jgi:hypothetical protein